MLIEGDLGALDPAWKGWRFKRGALVDPDGTEYAMGDVRAIPFMRLQIQTYQLEFRNVQMAWAVDQPVPESWADFVSEAVAAMK